MFRWTLAIASVWSVCAIAAPAAVKDGLLDLGFSPTVRAGMAIAVDAVTGDIYATGERTVYKFKRDGSIDESFQCEPSGAIEVIRATGGGRLLVAGDFNVGSTHSSVAMVDASGRIDTSFHNNVFGPRPPWGTIIEDCKLDSRGRIYVVGPFVTVNGEQRPTVVRLLPDGTVDAGYTVPSQAMLPWPVGITPDDRLLVVGLSGDILLRLNEDGSQDDTFQFPAGFRDVQILDVSDTGRIACSAGTQQGWEGIFVFLPDGRRDESFASSFLFDGGVLTGHWDGERIVASGRWDENVNAPRSVDWIGLKRFLRNGALDETWTSSAVAGDGYPLDIERDPEGGLVVGGSFRVFAGVPRLGLARLKLGSSTDLKWFNTSGRGLVTVGDPLIVGLIVAGDAPQRILVRGVGPTLAEFGVANPLAQPGLRVFRGSELLLEAIDGRISDSAAEAAAAVGAFPLHGRDVADTITLPPGAYTIVVASGDGGSGTALAEAYALDVQ